MFVQNALRTMDLRATHPKKGFYCLDPGGHSLVLFNDHWSVNENSEVVFNMCIVESEIWLKDCLVERCLFLLHQLEKRDDDDQKSNHDKNRHNDVNDHSRFLLKEKQELIFIFCVYMKYFHSLPIMNVINRL